MKKILLSLIVAAVFAAPADAQKKPAASKGKKAPVKEQMAPAKEQAATKSLPIGADIPNEGAMLPATAGPGITLGQAKTDKGLLVMFSCNTCPYVIKAQSRTAEAIDLAKRLGIGMVILNSNTAQRGAEDSREAMISYAVMQKYSVPYVLDESNMMADLFGATRTPEVFLFDGSGKLVYKGAMEDNPAEPGKSKQLYLSDAMKALSGHERILTAETKSIGCSIKRMQ